VITLKRSKSAAPWIRQGSSFSGGSKLQETSSSIKTTATIHAERKTRDQAKDNNCVVSNDLTQLQDKVHLKRMLMLSRTKFWDYSYFVESVQDRTVRMFTVSIYVERAF